MREIFSPSNPEIQRVKRLSDKRYRDETDSFYIEGARNVLDILDVAAPNSVRSIFITDKFLDEIKLSRFSEKLILTNEICINRMSDTKTPQGILAVLDKPKFVSEPCEKSVLLDGVTDGGNLGTIIRTCAACGYGVILKDCADIFSPKVVRSCMSAILKTEIFLFDEKLIRDFKSFGVKFFAGDMHGDNIFDILVKPKKVCIVIGNEAFGISKEVLDLCDRKVSIPMENMESLNASVSAAILMYNLKY